MGIHEMGTARMGRDPKTSVLNSHNQVWDAPNVFVTDGSCMASSACVNPSLTYMALTARAADYRGERAQPAQPLTGESSMSDHDDVTSDATRSERSTAARPSAA